MISIEKLGKFSSDTYLVRAGERDIEALYLALLGYVEKTPAMRYL